MSKNVAIVYVDELLQSCLASRYCDYNNGGLLIRCFGDFAAHYPLIMKAHPLGKSCFPCIKSLYVFLVCWYEMVNVILHYKTYESFLHWLNLIFRPQSIDHPNSRQYENSLFWKSMWTLLKNHRYSLTLLRSWSLCRNVVSFSDGLPEKGNGIPYFYLTNLDPTARNALKDPRASLSISESPIGTCKRDPMDPTCSKLTLTGKVHGCKKSSFHINITI